MQRRRSLAVIGMVFTGLVLVAVATTGGCPVLAGNPVVVNVSMTSLDTFSPQSILIEPGNIVRWTNNDTDNHTVIVDPLNPALAGPNSDLTVAAGVAPGGTFQWTVPGGIAPGTTWYYHCRFHGTAGDGTHLGVGMVGVMTAF